MKIHKITEQNHHLFITPTLRATRVSLEAAKRVKKECEKNGLKCAIEKMSTDGEIRYYIYAK